MEKIKKVAKKVTEITLYVAFAVMFICGVCFIADQLNIVSQKVYADTPAKEVMLPSTTIAPSIDYTRVYAYGKYYLVFYSIDSYGSADIEVIGPVN